jgi:hypothetical protein
MASIIFIPQSFIRAAQNRNSVLLSRQCIHMAEYVNTPGRTAPDSPDSLGHLFPMPAIYILNLLNLKDKINTGRTWRTAGQGVQGWRSQPGRESISSARICERTTD